MAVCTQELNVARGIVAAVPINMVAVNLTAVGSDKAAPTAVKRNAFADAAKASVLGVGSIAEPLIVALVALCAISSAAAKSLQPLFAGHALATLKGAFRFLTFAAHGAALNKHQPHIVKTAPTCEGTS